MVEVRCNEYVGFNEHTNTHTTITSVTLKFKRKKKTKRPNGDTFNICTLHLSVHRTTVQSMINVLIHFIRSTFSLLTGDCRREIYSKLNIPLRFIWTLVFINKYFMENYSQFNLHLSSVYAFCLPIFIRIWVKIMALWLVKWALKGP